MDCSLKGKKCITITKYMTPISRNVYIDILADKANEYNNTYHKTIKIKPVDVNSDTYIDFGVENYGKYPKF